MIFKRINRDQIESIFVIVQNNQGAQMVKDAAMQLDISTAVDGLKAVRPTTAGLGGFLGVCDQAINDQDFGLLQVWGYRSSSIVFQTNTSQAAGLPAGPVNAQNYVQTYASTDASGAFLGRFAMLAESIASSSASATLSAKLFLRALG